jgi:hypothetical protein
MILDINGTHVNVEDSFADLPDAQKQATVDHIASSLSPAPADPVTVNNVVRSTATGVPIIGGLLNKADAVTDAALAPALNSLFDEKDQLPEPTFGERYEHSLRDQEGSDAKFASQHSVIDTGAKIAGGVAAMAPIVGAAPGLFGASGSFASRVGMGGLSNAIVGGADSATRGEGPESGALLGGALGAAAPIAEAAASPFISAITARLNPQGFATRQVARAMGDSGQSVDQIANNLTSAAADGQGGQFNLADAMGNAGHELLGAAARGPGEGRTAVIDALEGRQAGQGRRISNALSEGFNAPETAAQTEARMTAARGAQADTDYGTVRNDAGRVDVLPAINHIDETLGPGADQQLANGGSAVPNDETESALQGFRNRLARVNPDDFSSVQRIRGDMADAAQNAMQSGYGNRARSIRGAIGHLDTAMENASNGFRQANANFRNASRDIDAVGQGRDASMRGRTEDTIPTFNAMRPEAQQAFRAGYVDPLIADAQGAPVGANKARPLMNDARRDEAAAMAPGNDLMQRRIGREQTMAEGRNTALGGSPTAKNLAHDAAAGIDPHLVMAAATGNWHSAIGRILQAGHNGATGNTPAVRREIANILLRNGANMTGAQLNQMVGRTIAQIQFLQTMARSGVGAAAVTINSNSKPPIFARTQ